jgi:hypothetical protein
MKKIEELIGNEATERLKERYGELVDWVEVEEQGPQVFKMTFQISDWKKMHTGPTNRDKERVIGIGVGEIEDALYHVLNFSDNDMEHGLHFNNNLPRNGIHMHREIYMELMGSEKESMRRVEERLKRLNEQKKGGIRR